MSVAIVTDSTSTIPKELLEKYKIRVGPQVVIWDQKEMLDGIDISPTEFYDRLEKSSTMPTTSQCTIRYFVSIFEELAAEGHDILCVLISNKLSGTINSAVQAREQVKNANIEIVDSLSTAMGLGFQVIEAAKAAEEGKSLAECKAIAESNVTKAGVIITPETLEYLHRGGRIGGGAKFLATALNIKPVLDIQDGGLEAVERVRTRKKVIKRIAEIAAERIGDKKPVYLAALHANSEADARILLEEAKALISHDNAMFTEVSPAIGVHTGPGTIGLCWYTG